ncbi:MAG: hypothetical protein K6E85_12470 [Lachnospiraceae bacterium]|nr:hypothetical protein [Lachnospiraceae bacterium]
MKKAISVLLILTMILSLAACSKKDDPKSEDNSKVTEAPSVTKDAEPSKAAETTPEPTKEATPEPTKEVTPEPTATPTPEPTEEPEPDPDYDEFQVDVELKGLYLCENGWSMTVEPEGSADIISVFGEHTDKSTFGSYHMFWTNYDSQANALVSSQEIYHYMADEMQRDVLETENTFELVADGVIYWVNEDMQFIKVSDDTSENPNYINYDYNYEGGDYGDGFGAEFTLENKEIVDLVGTTFYGVYCQSASDPMVGSLYPYYGDEMSLDTLDEFNCAFLYLGLEEDQGQLCFLEEGMNEDVTWTLEEDEFGTVLLLNGSYSGETYRGRFYWDNEDVRPYVCVRIGEYDLWMSSDPGIVSIAMTEEEALQAIINYINETDESMSRMLENGEYGVALGVATLEDGNIWVWLRSYTGAYKYYYIDPASGETHVTEFAPMMDDAVETPIDESLNAWDYVY